MRQALGIGLLIIGLIGCRQTPKELVHGSQGPETPNPDQQDKTQNITDTQVCQNTSPHNQTIYTFWSADFRKGNAKIHRTFRFEANSILRRVTCTLNNHSVTAEARASASISASSIKVLSFDQTDKPYNDGTTQFTCSTKLVPGETMEYSFVGPCVKLKTADSETVMIPGP